MKATPITESQLNKPKRLTYDMSEPARNLGLRVQEIMSRGDGAHSLHLIVRNGEAMLVVNNGKLEILGRVR